MLPLLYEPTHPIPSPDRLQYLGRLTKCKSCVVTNQINNNYDLSAAFFITDELLDRIENQNFLLAKPNPFDPPQFFEIYNFQEENNTVTVKGRHIKHCAYNNTISDVFTTVTAVATPQRHWEIIEPLLNMDNFFQFSSAIITEAAMQTGWSRAGTLGDFLKEMAQVFGGEFYYDNFNISFLQRLGSKKNYVLRWNRNITDPKLTLTADNVYSHVVAYGNFKITETGTDATLCSVPVRIGSDQKLYKLYKIYMWDATNTFDSTEISRDQIMDYRVSLRNRARAFVNGAGNAVQTEESPNLTVNYRPILDEMSAVGLGEKVDVELKSGRIVEARITKTSYDSLAERWTSITLGNEILKVSDLIAKVR